MRLKDAVDNSFRTARIFERALRVFEIVATEPVFTAELGETLMVMPWKQSSPPYLVHLTKKNISQFCQRLDKGWLPKEEMFALRMGLSEKQASAVNLYLNNGIKGSDLEFLKELRKQIGLQPETRRDAVVRPKASSSEVLGRGNRPRLQQGILSVEDSWPDQGTSDSCSGEGWTSNRNGTRMRKSYSSSYSGTSYLHNGTRVYPYHKAEKVEETVIED